MKIFSTFTGIGGFEIGIQNAYRSTERSGSSRTSKNQGKDRKRLQQSSRQDIGTSERSVSASIANEIDNGPLFVGYSEIDKYAISVYEKHFKGVKNYGDITKIKAEELPDFDCLVGGFPCQAFSIAGKRAGFNDTRGTLFFDLARILRAKQPRLFVFENVKGLLSHDNGNTFRTIIATIDELGYDCQWQVLNSKNYGVPQNRERIIIVGHLRGTPRPEVFPIARANSQAIEQINNPSHSNDQVYDPNGISPTLNTAQGGNRQPFIIGGLQAHASTMVNCSTALMEAMGKDGGHTPMVNAIRRLTPLECERLQGFPDNWTKYLSDGSLTSDTQRYKMCGNAVNTNVIQAVFEKILE